MDYTLKTPNQSLPTVRTVHADEKITCLEIEWHRAYLLAFGKGGVSWDDEGSDEPVWPEIQATEESVRDGWRFWSAMALRDSIRVTFIRNP